MPFEFNCGGGFEFWGTLSTSRWQLRARVGLAAVASSQASC